MTGFLVWLQVQPGVRSQTVQLFCLQKLLEVEYLEVPATVRSFYLQQVLQQMWHGTTHNASTAVMGIRNLSHTMLAVYCACNVLGLNARLHVRALKTVL